jgi:hypothetical protein
LEFATPWASLADFVEDGDCAWGDGLQDGAAEASDECGLFGLELALSSGRKSAGERDAEAGLGEVVSGKGNGDVATDALPRGLFGFAAGVKVAEIRTGGAGQAAAAAVFEREQTPGRAVLGRMCRHDDLQIDGFSCLGLVSGGGQR